MQELTIIEGIIVGATGGLVAGLTLWIIGRLNEYEKEWHEKRRIYRWLDKVTKDDVSRPWRRTRAIASYTNLPEERVRYLCSHHEYIVQSSGDNEVWSIKGRARDENNNGTVKK